MRLFSVSPLLLLAPFLLPVAALVMPLLADTTGIDLLQQLDKLGALGVVLVILWLLLVGKLRPEREVLDRDRTIAQLWAVLTQSTHLTDRAAGTARDLAAVMPEVARAVPMVDQHALDTLMGLLESVRTGQQPPPKGGA